MDSARPYGNASDHVPAQADDEALELEIEACRQAMLKSLSEQDRRYWWAEMSARITQRTPEQIERMERSRGLR